MPKSFLKDNFVLIVGLTLPVLLMAGFLIASSLPSTLSDPPQHDLIFAVADYPSVPVNVRLVVKDRLLTAQYTRPTAQVGTGVWKKLYRYEAERQAVRELPFGIPADVDSITGMREETVDATANLILDTSLRAPDGYELSSGTGNRGGILNDLFWSSYSNEVRLRKGSSSVRLTTGTDRVPLYAGNVEFIGWVVGQK